MSQDPIGTQLPLALIARYSNQYLFSDHYLDTLLPNDPRWNAAREEIADFLTWLRDLYTREGDHLNNYNETQLEAHWFEPIFARLGHTFERQASIPGLDKNIRKPDYVFFPTDAARQAAVATQRTDDYARHALAVGEVKQWAIDLGKKQPGGGNSFDRQNPSFQIDYYLKATGLSWGILTNGRKWRLVHRETSYRLDTYYEIDLLDLLTRDDPVALTYFYLFFRQAAFRPDVQGRHFLDDVLAGSAAYAVALEEDLQANAYRALELLMQGFLDLNTNALTAADLREIYDNSLYLLYRLLFILYGESRGLLPVDNPRYRKQYSFDTIKQQALSDIDSGDFVSRYSTIYWWRLQNLFHLINGDDPAFNAEIHIVRYNGGLFDPATHPFLAEKAVGDQALIAALDLLARRTAESGLKEFVDYRTLNVRHLGSIYEGLLEYQPRLATERMVVVRAGKGEQWLSAAQAPQDAKITDRRAAGQIYLETDKGERKATGSYYTPQYIVAYIVEQTLGPLIQRIVADIKSAATTEAQAGRVFAEKVLALKVLDPAMGSGHFLVEATDYLARALATDPYVETDATTPESDLNHWRRRVVERCIYGVDKNPLAVELAKLSLWLNTFAGDKPLGFLDHHLKCGDSLVGAQIAALEERPEILLSQKEQRQRAKEVAAGAQQLGLGLFSGGFNRSLPEMLRELFAIMETESADYAAVRAKEAANTRVERLKAPFQTIANLYTSAHFGNPYDEAAYKEALRAIGDPEQLYALPAIQAAQTIAAERRFLHWELTFPEIFFDQHGQPLAEEERGFDAVIGNPPYVSAWEMTNSDEDIRTTMTGLAGFGELLSKHWDLYIPFLLQSYQLSKGTGRISFIIPDSFCREKYAAEVRKFFLEHTQIEWLGYFEEENVFEGVSRHTVIPTFCKAMPDLEYAKIKVKNLALSKKQIITPIVEVHQGIFLNVPEYQLRYQNTPSVFNLVSMIDNQSIKLGEICYVNYGAQVSSRDKGGFGKADVVHNSPVGSAKRFIDGKNLQRFNIIWDNRYLDYQPQKMYGPRSPELFENPKIVIRDVTGANEQLMVSYDDSGYYCDHLIICATYYDNIKGTDLQQGFRRFNRLSVPYSLLYITSIVASQVVTWYFRKILATGTLQGSYSHTYPQQIRVFPIRRIEFTTPAADRAALLEQAIARYEQTLATPLRDYKTTGLSDFLTARLAAAPEQADVTHDLLARLAEQMIELNRQKQQRVNDFYLDLEGVTDPATFAALQKGKQARSLWQTAACRPYVNETSGAAHALVESLVWSEDAYKAFLKILAGKITGLSDFIAIYRAHAPAYTALVHRLAATDRLIDQIVYQLYGLTDEEIAIVEGRAPDAAAVQ